LKAISTDRRSGRGDWQRPTAVISRLHPRAKGAMFSAYVIKINPPQRDQAG
jgi:hypothetical protein